MTHALTLTNNQPAALARLAAATKSSVDMRLVKFNKGIWSIGDNQEDGGRRFIAHADQLAHGWIKFLGGKVAEQRIGLVTDTAFVLPERDELGDTDESRWETDPSGKPRDPWVFQQYMPLEDADSGELFSFVTGSQGGKSGISKLVNLYVRNVHRGLPIVRLGKDSYKHKQFGRVETPEFQVAAWTGAPANHEPPPYDGPTYDMDESF